MRVVQPVGTKGSLKWIQRAIECHSDVLQPQSLPTVNWASPVAEDVFAEYSDADFLDIIGCGNLAAELRAFWPNRGPQWDALGVFDGGCILVEAKAHLAEFISPPCKAGAASRHKIDQALRAVSDDLGISQRHNWAEQYYQYTNRLAHLWWLRQEGVNAHLLYVGFVGDTDMGGPSDVQEWQDAYHQANLHLGLPAQHALSPYIHHISPDVAQL